MSFEWTQSTYNPALLVILSGLCSLLVVVLRLLAVRRLAVFTGVIASLGLVILAGQHIPLVTLVAPRTFCFGDVGFLHLLAFSLPVGSALVRRQQHGSAEVV